MLLALQMEEGHEPRDAGSLQKLEKQGERLSSRVSKGTQPCIYMLDY